MRATKNAATAAAVGTWAILLTAFVVTILYVGRQLLIPLALAAMLTFLLAPLVGYIERWIGRIAAVLIVVAMLFGVFGGAGWLLTRQLIDLAAKLPDYQTNIDNKLNAIRLPTGGAFGRLSHSVSELQKQLPDSLEPPANATSPVPETKATTARALATCQRVNSQCRFGSSNRKAVFRKSCKPPRPDCSDRSGRPASFLCSSSSCY